jgi:uncharacterized membrane protein
LCFWPGRARILHGQAIGTRALSKFLVTRGLVLVALELTVVKFSWGFNLDYAAFTLAGVIWMIGWCMVLLAALVWIGLTRERSGSLASPSWAFSNCFPWYRDWCRR